MSIQIIEPHQFVKQQWKNGGGSTLELLRYPENRDDYLMRMSIAEVNMSGPFSVFPDCQRSICQLEGPPICLSHGHNGAEVALKPGEPYEFSGDWLTDCQVAGPARDFNVIWKSDRVDCTVEYIYGLQRNEIDSKTASAVFLYVPKGFLNILRKNEPVQLLKNQHLMIMNKEPQSFVIEPAPGTAVLVVYLWAKE